jgi:hypothetical protein
MDLYKDILLEEERINLLENFIKLSVKDLGESFPGLQSSPTIHLHEEMKILLKKIKPYHEGYTISRCWANFSRGNIIAWHNHHDEINRSKKSMVYFLENKCGMGPMFKVEPKHSFPFSPPPFRVKITQCPENSLLLFDNTLIHSMPCHLPQDRYSIAFDIVK